MRYRIKKKHIRNYNSRIGKIEVSGNNGGDLLSIYDNKDDTITIQSGHCCVMDMSYVLPVEVVTGIFNRLMMDNNGDINKVTDYALSGHNSQYVSMLKSKIHKY